MQHKNLKSYFVIKDTKNTERYKQDHSYSTVHRQQHVYSTCPQKQRYTSVKKLNYGYQIKAPERSKQVLVPSSPARPDSVKVLNRVPMGSRGCPTQPSMLVMEVWPLWSNSEENINIIIIN